MTTGTLPDDVRLFLERVRERLDDLPAQEREDLLTDVEPSVLASAQEGDAPVEARLGPPERFADELRAAAGLPPRTLVIPPPSAAPIPEPRPPLRDVLRAHPVYQRLDGPARELAPMWWLVRGYVAVCVLAAAVAGEWTAVPFRSSGAFETVASVLVGIGVSVWIGLRRRRASAAAIVVNVALVLCTLAVAAVGVGDLDASRYADTVYVNEPMAGLSFNGGSVGNVFAFDRNGALLYDVRLFDGDGQPLTVGDGDADPMRRVPKSSTGDLAYNDFPIRYFEPGTTRVANPSAGAPPSPGPLTGEPLVPTPDAGGGAAKADPKAKAKGDGGG